MKIEWTKDYRVSHERGIFKILISRHGDTSYYASLLYYQKESGELRFALHTDFGASEQEALDKAKVWIDRELPGKYSVDEKPKMREIGQTVTLG